MISFATATEISADDIYLGYLPLAHVLELMGGGWDCRGRGTGSGTE